MEETGDSNNFQNLNAIYDSTCSEVTRYRDFEWKNVAVFTTAIVAIVFFALTNTISDGITAGKSEKVLMTPELALWLESALVALFLGNVYWSLYVHTSLASNRVLKARLEQKMGIAWIRGEALSLDFKENFRNGFYNYIVPFLILNFVLVLSGYWVIMQRISRATVSEMLPDYIVASPEIGIAAIGVIGLAFVVRKTRCFYGRLKKISSSAVRSDQPTTS